MTLEQVASLSLFGKAAIALFIVAWFGAALTAVPLFSQLARLRQSGSSIWSDADQRPKFIRFIGFCALGVASALMGILVGGWPSR